MTAIPTNSDIVDDDDLIDDGDDIIDGNDELDISEMAARTSCTSKEDDDIIEGYEDDNKDKDVKHSH